MVKPYTGTRHQPDAVSVFFKYGKGRDEIKIADETIVNSLGHSPLHFITAIPRITKAVKKIFKILKGVSYETRELWNAFKNLARGTIQLIPCAGNVTLFAYDLIRTNLYFHPKIKTALADEKEPVMGIAFDGKVVVKFSSEAMKSILSDKSKKSIDETHDSSLVTLQYMWLALLSKASENKSTCSRFELTQKLKNHLEKCESQATYPKKIEVQHYQLLHDTIKLFKKGHSQEALELFKKLPQEIKNAIYGDFYNDNKFNDDRWGCAEKVFLNLSIQKIADKNKIEAIEEFLSKIRVKK